MYFAVDQLFLKIWCLKDNKWKLIKYAIIYNIIQKQNSYRRIILNIS